MIDVRRNVLIDVRLDFVVDIWAEVRRYLLNSMGLGGDPAGVGIDHRASKFDGILGAQWGPCHKFSSYLRNINTQEKQQDEHRKSEMTYYDGHGRPPSGATLELPRGDWPY